MKYKGVPKQKREIKKLQIPKIINTDLTYYMQFGYAYQRDIKKPKEEAKKYDKMPLEGIPDYYG